MKNQQASKVESAVETTAQPPLYVRKKDGSVKKARMVETLFYISIVILPMLQLSLYYVYVNFDAFFMSFQQWDAITGEFSWVGFDNFRKVLFEVKQDGGWLNVSLVQSCVTWIASKIFMPLDILFAYYCYKKMPGWNFFKGMLYLPQVLSAMVISLLVQYMFNNLIPEIAMTYFGKRVNPMLNVGGWDAYWTDFWWTGLFSCGGGILLYTTIMSRIPESLTEYAYLEGCGPMREFLTITFPLIFGTFAVNLVGGVAAIFSSNGSWFTYFGTGSTNPSSVGYFIYCLTLDSKGYSNYPYASACGMFFTLFAVPLTLGMRWLTDKIDPKVQY
ncbi:MAG: sugar ABC transporter permease [Clostridia bacterium]|nr:sugar ABC transporter permease [Clostridia bacterium]